MVIAVAWAAAGMPAAGQAPACPRGGVVCPGWWRCPAAAVRLYVASTGFSLVPWFTAGSRQRAIELGARGGGTAHGFRRAAWLWAGCGLVPPPGGKLRGSAAARGGGYLTRPPRRSRPRAGPGAGRRRSGRPTPGRW
jgi:hypothetical protein